jgi:predicted N-acetyltransferase YhbS
VPYVPIRIGKRWFRYWARNYWPGELRRLVARAGFTVVDRTFVWQTFENISGQQPGWISRSRFALRAVANLLERTPGLRVFGVSQAILARREPPLTEANRIGDVTLRPATDSEPPHLARVEDEAGELFAKVGMPEVAAMPARDPASLRAAQVAGLLWVADSAADGLVGFALAEPFGESLHLEELSVSPSHGRRGIGAGLVACVAEAAVLRGYTQVTLSTFSEVPWNAPYYRRLGVVEITAPDLPAELRAVRAREAAAGLAVEQRVIMRRRLAPPAPSESEA